MRFSLGGKSLFSITQLFHMCAELHVPPTHVFCRAGTVARVPMKFREISEAPRFLYWRPSFLPGPKVLPHIAE